MFTASDHTFVVCAYKENPYIEDTILSLKSQTVLGEIILSTSTPNRYLKDVCERHDINMVINPTPRSAGDDWNYGYDHASTPLITLAHQDDIYDPDYLDAFLTAVNAYNPSDVLLVFSDYYELRDKAEIHSNAILRVKRFMNSIFRIKPLNKMRLVKRRVLSLGDSISCPTVMLVKPTTGPAVFNTTFINSCDYKTWVDLASRKGRFVYVPKRLVGHRIYEDSATTKNLNDNIRQDEDLAILCELWPKPLARLINSLYSKSEKSNEL